MIGIPVNAAQGIGHRSHQIRAAPDRFRDNHVGAGGFRQTGGCVGQGVEPAAETSAGNLLGGEAEGPQHRGVHQFAALVVGDQAHPVASPGQLFGEAGDGGGFAGTEKTADHDVTGAGEELLGGPWKIEIAGDVVADVSLRTRLRYRVTSGIPPWSRQQGKLPGRTAGVSFNSIRHL